MPPMARQLIRQALQHLDVTQPQELPLLQNARTSRVDDIVHCTLYHSELVRKLESEMGAPHPPSAIMYLVALCNKVHGCAMRIRREDRRQTLQAEGLSMVFWGVCLSKKKQKTVRWLYVHNTVLSDYWGTVVEDGECGGTSLLLDIGVQDSKDRTYFFHFRLRRVALNDRRVVTSTRPTTGGVLRMTPYATGIQCKETIPDATKTLGAGNPYEGFRRQALRTYHVLEYQSGGTLGCLFTYDASRRPETTNPNPFVEQLFEVLVSAMEPHGEYRSSEEGIFFANRARWPSKSL